MIHSTPTVVDGCVFTGTDLGQRLRAERRHRRGRLGRGARRQAAAAHSQGAGIVGAPAVAERPRLRRRHHARGVGLGQRSTRPRARSSGRSVIDSDSGGGVDSSPVPFNGMVFQAFQGDESSNHSKPGLRDPRRLARGRRRDPRQDPHHPGGRTTRPATAAARSSTPRPIDLERQLVVRRHRQPGEREAEPEHERAAEDRRRSRVARRSAQILASHRGTLGQLPGPAGRRLADLPDRAPVAGRPLHVRAVRLQLPVLAEPLDRSRRAQAVRRPAEVGRVHRRSTATTMEQAWQATLGAAVLRLQPQLDRRSTRTASTSPSAAATSTR